ncbi:meiosis 1 arrest protein [Lates japonicus]|uniref:Meiosis 1 arrest protein n=1 Tax=Lates japonicus TaxID=270547 RepID=A0AAD3NFU9_LATJO|nr:meiosis 1 arrest protein [Lates japonicus]
MRTEQGFRTVDFRAWMIKSAQSSALDFHGQQEEASSFLQLWELLFLVLLIQAATSQGPNRGGIATLVVTVVTSQPGRGIVRQLEMGLKDADLVSLKRLLVVQIYRAGDLGQDTPSPEATCTETEEFGNNPNICQSSRRV